MGKMLYFFTVLCLMGLSATQASPVPQKNENPEHGINKRAIGCSKTKAYGSVYGVNFADFNNSRVWPCGVDITEIQIRHSIVIDSIHVKYKTVEEETIVAPIHGGGGGRMGIVHLADGERITGASGVVCVDSFLSLIDPYVSQLIFFSEKEDGEKKVHGPYGAVSRDQRYCKLFAVNGKINSIFGRVLNIRGYLGLGAIGFYFEDTGRASQSTE